MPPSRGRRSKPRQPRLANNRTGKPERTPSEADPAQPGPGRRTNKWLRIWQITSGILGAVVTVTGLFWLKPQVQIEPSVNLDPSQPLATQFQITNRGNVPVYNVNFSCDIRGATYIGNLTGNMSTLAPVAVLPPGRSVTRACALESAKIDGNTFIEISATYAWPIIGRRSTEPG